MTKVEIRETIETVFGNHKSTKAIELMKADLLKAFESKVLGSINPPIINEDGSNEYWCKFHKRYEIEENMVMSLNAKTGVRGSKGYCKAGVSSWTRKMNLAKSKDKEAIESLSKGEMEIAQESAKLAISLKAEAQDYDLYDFDQDWDNFKSVPKKEV